MAVTAAATDFQLVNFGGSNSKTYNGTLTVPTCEHMTLLVMGRCPSGTSPARVVTVTHDSAAVSVISENFSAATQIFDAVNYWIGCVASPGAGSKSFTITTDKSQTGIVVIAFFRNGVDATDPIKVYGSQLSASTTNTVNLSGTPTQTGGHAVAALAESDGASTITASLPTGWTQFANSTYTVTGEFRLDGRYTAITNTSGITVTSQFSNNSTQIGGVFFEIQPLVSANVGEAETAATSDSVSATVSVSVGLTETASTSDSVSASGGATLTSPENPASVYRDAACVWKLPSGKSIKDSQDLTVSGLSSATLMGTAATFTATSYGRRTAPDLGGPTKLTVEFWINFTSFGQVFWLGPSDGTSVRATVGMAVTSAGAWQIVRKSATATQTCVSADGSALTGTTYHVVLVCGDGDDPILYLNGAAKALSVSGPSISATYNFGASDELSLGDPSFTATGFAGTMGRVVLWPFAMTSTRAIVSYRVRNSTAEWLGQGAENGASDSNVGAVAVPVHQSVTAGLANTINVIGKAYDRDGDSLSIVSGSLTASSGTASIVSGNISWTPASAATGVQTVGFQIKDATPKPSSSKVYGRIVTTAGDYYLNPWSFDGWMHRPIGAGAVEGVPEGPDPSAQRTDPRNDIGSLANLGAITLNGGKALQKWIVQKDTTHAGENICLINRADRTQVTLQSTQVFFPSFMKTAFDVLAFDATAGYAEKEQCLVVYDATTGSATLYHSMCWEASNNRWLCDVIKTYRLDGSDWHDPADGMDGGTSASQIRFTAGCLFDADVSGGTGSDPDPGPIQHALAVTVTGNNHVGGDIAGQNWCWPAKGRDSYWANNKGNVPYGARFWIPPRFASVRNTIGLNNRGKRLFDLFRFYGAILADTSSDTTSTGKGIMQIRLGRRASTDFNATLLADLKTQVQKLVPYISVIKNTRNQTTESEILAATGLPYAGGGGALDPAQSINTAIDAPG